MGVSLPVSHVRAFLWCSTRLRTKGHLEHISSMHPHAHVVSKGGPLSLLAETIQAALALSVRVAMQSASEPVPRS